MNPCSLITQTVFSCLLLYYIDRSCCYLLKGLQVTRPERRVTEGKQALSDCFRMWRTASDLRGFLLQEATRCMACFKSTWRTGLSWLPCRIVNVTIPACRCSSYISIIHINQWTHTTCVLRFVFVSYYPPVDVLDLTVHFHSLEKGLRWLEEAKDEDVTTIVTDAENRHAPSGAVIRCHVT